MFKENIPRSNIRNFLSLPQSKDRVYSIKSDGLNVYNPLSFNFLNARFKNIHQYAVYCGAVYCNDDLDYSSFISKFHDEKYAFFDKNWSKVKIKTPIKRFEKYYFNPKGLKYDVMIAPDKKKIVLIFRGTRITKFWDIYTNLKWIFYFFPFIHDYYDQLIDIAPKIVEEIHSRYGNDIEIIATGHSLGGGLAQQAAYTSKYICKAYVFNPSPITGLLNLRLSSKKQEKEGLRIYRIFEKGEFLEYLRALKNTILPLSEKNPEIETIQFNRVKGDVFSEHSMEQLAKEINEMLTENKKFKLESSNREYMNAAV